MQVAKLCPSTSRREFIKTFSTSLAALSLTGPLAWASSLPKLSFALIADTHLGRETGDEKLWEQAVKEINAAQVNFSIFAGDLVDHGEEPKKAKYYQQWADIARGLKAPLIAVPGNHDPSSMFKKYIHPRSDQVYDLGPLRVIAFNNTKINPEHDGAISKSQLKWLAESLAAEPSAGKSVILVQHIVYRKNVSPDRGWYLKRGRKAYKKLLKRYQDRIFAIFSGHFHTGLRGWSDTFGIHEVILPAISHNSKLDQLVEKNGGFYPQEFRQAWVLAETKPDSLDLKIKPLGDRVLLSHQIGGAIV